MLTLVKKVLLKMAGLGAIVASIGAYIYTAEQARAERDDLQAQVGRLTAQINTEITAKESCLHVNLENWQNARAAEKRAHQGEIKVTEIKSATDQTLQELRHEAEKYRGLDCSRVTDDDKRNLVNWLRE
jgi:peptidyl-tRNA hydrolase